jgi:hypothetical protein
LSRDAAAILPAVTLKKPPAKKAAPSKPAPRKTAAKTAGPPRGDELDAAILRFLRRFPNNVVDLAPLAAELSIDPFSMQLAVERLHRRRMLVAPFIEPGTAGGAELAERGLRWLIAREGGKPKDRPVANQPATGHVRVQEEAKRLPRAEVYGVRRRA